MTTSQALVSDNPPVYLSLVDWPVDRAPPAISASGGQSFFTDSVLRPARRGVGLEVVLIDKGKDHIEIELMDETGNVLLEPLKERLLADPTVDIATYDSDHPLYGTKRLYVRVTSGKPQNAVKRALKDLSGVYEKALKQVEKAEETKGS